MTRGQLNRLGIVVPGGSVEAASALGQGCAFELRVRAAPDDAAVGAFWRPAAA